MTNTNAIIVAQGATATNYAAGLARAYNGGGYSDWYLPSKDELDKLYLNRVAVGGLGAANYWSSSEANSINVWLHVFGAGNPLNYAKNTSCGVRAVRTF